MADYIRREDALRAVQKQRGANRSPAQNAMLDRICCDIKNRPAADVAPVVYGRWERVFDHYTTGYADAVFAVEDFPSVDAVPVVRCQDCKSFRRNNENDPYCADRRGLSDPKPDDYCSYGERREE